MRPGSVLSSNSDASGSSVAMVLLLIVFGNVRRNFPIRTVKSY